MQTKKILFSIVIPYLYKPKILSECLKSILNQNINKNLFEVIIIDDGSKKDSQMIISKYRKLIYKLSYIKLIDNSGPGLARNIGIKKAIGNYIFFLDCDDFIKPNTLIELKKIIETKNYDVVSFNYELVDNIKKKFMRNDKDILNVKKQKFIKLFLSMNYNNSVIFAIYKRSYILKNKIFFKTGYHEDILFFFKSFFYIKSKIFINKNLYVKKSISNSITNTFSEKHIHDYLTSWIDVKEFLIKKYTSRYFNKFFLKYYSKGLIGLVAILILKNIKFNKYNKFRRFFYYKIILHKINKLYINDINKSKVNIKSRYDKLFKYFIHYTQIESNNKNFISYEENIKKIGLI